MNHCARSRGGTWNPGSMEIKSWRDRESGGQHRHQVHSFRLRARFSKLRDSASKCLTQQSKMALLPSFDTDRRLHTKGKPVPQVDDSIRNLVADTAETIPRRRASAWPPRR